MNPRPPSVEPNPFPRDRTFLVKLVVYIAIGVALVWMGARTIRRALLPGSSGATAAPRAADPARRR